MRNRITYNCKTLKHRILLYWFITLMCSLITNPALAKSLTINVYLKLTANSQVATLIKEFNQFLEQQQMFTQYQITPYLEHHPLHVTLYMASYEQKQIPRIIKQSKGLAKQQKKITLTTSQFMANKSGYVMLTVNNNEKLQQLSNKALYSLTNLRDSKAKIPVWAIQDKQRLALFKHYGSPTVLNFFVPHFSIFSADHLDKKQKAMLYGQLQRLMVPFATNHKTKVKAVANAIGIGIANEQGQIVKELNAFALR